MLYFAYGSNLFNTRLQLGVPAAGLVSSSELLLVMNNRCGSEKLTHSITPSLPLKITPSQPQAAAVQ